MKNLALIQNVNGIRGKLEYVKTLLFYLKKNEYGYLDEQKIVFQNRYDDVLNILGLIEGLIQNLNSVKLISDEEKIFQSLSLINEKVERVLKYSEIKIEINMEEFITNQSYVNEVILSPIFTRGLKSIKKDCYQLSILINEALVKSLPIFVNQTQNELLNFTNTQIEKLKEKESKILTSSTESIYSTAQADFLKDFEKYQSLFYWIIAIILALFSGLHFFYAIDFNNLNTIFIRLFLLSFSVLAITYLLKLQNKYHKLYISSKLKSLELKAIPSYVKNLKTDDAQQFYSDLAPKYFGRYFDENSTSDNLDNIVENQIKLTNELIKSSAELIKVHKENSLTSNKQSNQT